MTCHRGCRIDEIVHAIGIEESDLFPRVDQHPGKNVEPKAPPRCPRTKPPKRKKRTEGTDKRKTATGLRTAPGAKEDWAAKVKQYEKALPKAALLKLAKALGVTPESLRLLHVGWRTHDGNDERGCWTFPEMDADGRVVGINRRYIDGSKRMIAGGQRGLYLPAGWRERPGPILICEGPTDAAALTAMGLAGIGRPSATGGVEHLAELLADVPKDRKIIVLGERDRKESGKWPGRDGAVGVAQKLTAKLGRKVLWALPPDGAKDVRAWLMAQTEASNG